MSPLRRNFAWCLAAVIAAMPINFLSLPGNHVVAALLTGFYQIPPVFYGWLVSLPFWANLLQAIVTPWLQSRFSAKAVSVGATAVHGFAWAGVGVAMFWLPREKSAAAGDTFLVILSVAALAASLAAVGWTSWMQEWVHGAIRGRMFAQFNRWGQLSQLSFLLAAGALLSAAASSAWAFQVLIFFAAAVRLLSAFFQSRVRPPNPRPSEERRHNWSAQLMILRAHRSYPWLVAFAALWAFGPAVFGPFAPVFMYEELGMSIKDVGWLVIVSGLAGSLAVPAWGRFADRHGNKPTLTLAVVLWMTSSYGWCFLTPQNWWILYPMWAFGGTVGTGFALCWFNLQLKLIPPAAKTLAISLILAVSSAVAALAPVLGGWALEWAFRQGFPRLEVYHVALAFHPTVALLALLLLRRVHEPAANPLVVLFGAMRNIRTLSGLLGLSLFTEFFFARRPGGRS